MITVYKVKLAFTRRYDCSSQNSTFIIPLDRVEGQNHAPLVRVIVKFYRIFINLKLLVKSKTWRATKPTNLPFIRPPLRRSTSSSRVLRRGATRWATALGFLATALGVLKPPLLDGWAIHLKSISGNWTKFPNKYRWHMVGECVPGVVDTTMSWTIHPDQVMFTEGVFIKTPVQPRKPRVQIWASQTSE